MNKIRLWYAARYGLRWMDRLADIPDSEPSLVPIRGASGLVPLPDGGAVLLWTFDLRTGGNPMLVVGLTEDEAQSVYDADPYTTGTLEPVRRHLTNRWAIMSIRSGPHRHYAPVRVPKYATEDEFIAELDRCADACPAYRFAAPPLTSRRSSAVRTVTRAMHGLAPA